MTWLFNLMQSELFQSIVSGVIIYVISQALMEFVFRPIKAFKSIIGEIDNKLKLYSNVVTNSGIAAERVQEARDVLRGLSCNLESSYKQIGLKKIFLHWVIPAQSSVDKAAIGLIRLSNTGGNAKYIESNFMTIDCVRRALNIKIFQ